MLHISWYRVLCDTSSSLNLVECQNAELTKMLFQTTFNIFTFLFPLNHVCVPLSVLSKQSSMISLSNEPVTCLTIINHGQLGLIASWKHLPTSEFSFAQHKRETIVNAILVNKQKNNIK